MKKLLIGIMLFLGLAVTVEAEVLQLDKADVNQITTANCLMQNAQLVAINKALLKWSGCTVQKGQVTCPDTKGIEKEKSE